MHAAAGSERWTHLETAEQMRHSNRTDFYIFSSDVSVASACKPHCHNVKELCVVVFSMFFWVVVFSM